MQTDYLGRLVELLQGLASSQEQAFSVGAKRAADAVEAGGLVHLFGSGHSVIPVMELFPRYGAFAGLNPLTDSRLMWSNVLGSSGVRELLWLERTEGYIKTYLDNQPISAGDVLVVFSHGGRNAAPIEAAMYGRERGAFVIGVTSVANAARPREHSSGKHLSELVDLVIDTGVPVEDALIYLDGFERPVGGASTLVAAAAVHQLMVATAAELHARGALPPVFVSPTVPGATVNSNDEVFESYRRRMIAAQARRFPPTG
ncbi:MAG: SIS domain-containing protein [Candidatus Limnocylindrales bacterium]